MVVLASDIGGRRSEGKSEGSAATATHTGTTRRASLVELQFSFFDKGSAVALRLSMAVVPKKKSRRSGRFWRTRIKLFGLGRTRRTMGNSRTCDFMSRDTRFEKYVSPIRIARVPQLSCTFAL